MIIIFYFSISKNFGKAVKIQTTPFSVISFFKNLSSVFKKSIYLIQVNSISLSFTAFTNIRILAKIWAEPDSDY